MAQDDLIPRAINAVIEALFIWSKYEILAPGGGFAAAAIGRYLFGQQERARGILRSVLERAGA
jgi:hypothetical protein